ncbi:MAG: hypothetical protein KatS3mg031_2821 [Chitinophagales bacterium]|jgi:hypothetical protein|nr:MAG: hypothetical protein KatS3mg031_2821 [Chitinophagales bacterium]
MFVIRNNKILVEPAYILAFREHFNEDGTYKSEESRRLFEYLFYFYSKESPYYETEKHRKIEVLSKKYNLDSKKFEEKYKEEIELFKDIYFSQEERVRERIKDKIDEAIEYFSYLTINEDVLLQMPKLSKAINDLIKFKEQLETSIGKSQKARGDRKLSLLESKKI